MNADVPLHLSYKGSRQYLHGTDIHDAVCDMLAERGSPDLGKIDFTLHRVIVTQLTASIFDDAVEDTEGANAIFRAATPAGLKTVIVREDGRPVLDRRPYDEDGLVANAQRHVNERSILLETSKGFSNIEMVVALNKALLQAVLPEAQGKWLFTRLQLASSFRHENYSRFEIRFLGHSNYRITRSQIFGDGRAIGSIFFSLAVSE